MDFSEPFLTIDTPVKQKKVPKQLSDTFSFLKPLSKEIWVRLFENTYICDVIMSM